MKVVFSNLLTTCQIDAKQCIVCFEEMKPEDEVVMLECNKEHTFHELCLRIWFKEKPQCPLCRTEIARIKEVTIELHQFKNLPNRTYPHEDHI